MKDRGFTVPQWCLECKEASGHLSTCSLYAWPDPRCGPSVNQSLPKSPEDGNASLSTQVGGDHYSKLPIQPIEYILTNGIGFAEGCAIKYLTRWRDKGGVEDLRKARHFIDMLIEHVEGGDK